MTSAAIADAHHATGADPLIAAALLAALSGVFLFVLGMFRLGFLASLLSHPVISGSKLYLKEQDQLYCFDLSR